MEKKEKVKIADLPDFAFIRPKQAASLLGISLATLYRLVWRGKLPKPRKITSRTVGWRLAELRQFLETLPETE